MEQQLEHEKSPYIAISLQLEQLEHFLGILLFFNENYQ